ncbi:hypothetical protein GDO78_014032 [Eleutherodactylus coqui]|uniref:Taste receptor type 2 n=1 Tax=Eleutherodactylus coqui TaxID=57060 RepID=A0A8J6JQL2_ELECQ|nr:hypothetical protein GDO78_014032 [Eleutherodactylus coqui]
MQYLGLLASALIALIAGLVIHLFIIGVNVTNWWKGRSVTPIDHIVTSLGMSRMGAQCANTLLLLIPMFIWRNLDPHVYMVGGLSYTFFSHASNWLTSLLSIVFCLKISNFHSRLFLYLRGMIVHRTVYFIVAAVLLSAVTILMTLLAASSDGIYNKTITNLTYCNNIPFVYSAAIGAIFSLLFYWISSVLLFTSLYHHTAKMKKSSNSSINLETYYSVMKFVSFTFIYNTLYFIWFFFCIFNYFFHCVNLDWLHIILNFLPVLHSSYLIYKTAKLRSQMSKVLQNVTDFLFQRKDLETRENIEVVAL